MIYLTRWWLVKSGLKFRRLFQHNNCVKTKCERPLVNYSFSPERTVHPGRRGGVARLPTVGLRSLSSSSPLPLRPSPAAPRSPAPPPPGAVTGLAQARLCHGGGRGAAPRRVPRRPWQRCRRSAPRRAAGESRASGGRRGTAGSRGGPGRRRSGERRGGRAGSAAAAGA